MTDNIEPEEQSEEPIEPSNDRHPLITLGILTAGSQMGSTLIQRMARHPSLLFSMGVVAGIYTYKNRKQIIHEAKILKDQGKKLLSVKPGPE